MKSSLSLLVCLSLILALVVSVGPSAMAEQGVPKVATSINVSKDRLVIEEGKTDQTVMSIYADSDGIRDPDKNYVIFYDTNGRMLLPEESVVTYTFDVDASQTYGTFVFTGVRVGVNIMRIFVDDITKDVRIEVTPRSVASIDDCYIDIIDPTGSSSWDDVDKEFWDVTGHKLRAGIYDAPIGYERSVKWKSSNTKVATIDKNGIITCKKAGTATITASWKGIPIKRTARLGVYLNEAQWDFDYNNVDLSTDYCHNQMKRAYIKSGRLCIDFYMYNNTPIKITRVSPQEIYLTADYEEIDYSYAGTFPAKLKGAIKPGKMGIMTVTLFNLNPSAVYLQWTGAYARGAVYGKDVESGEGLSADGNTRKGSLNEQAPKMPTQKVISRFGTSKRLPEKK